MNAGQTNDILSDKPLVTTKKQAISTVPINAEFQVAANEGPMSNRLWAKQLIDRCLAAIGILLIAPVLILIAIAVKFSSRGPVLFSQLRYGQHRSMITVYKFRTMRVNRKAQFTQATRDDPRVTRVGWFLRRTSLDELPQLLNVLNGSMSLVGPRPHPVTLDAQYTSIVPHLNNRYRVKPGITGLAQINGFRGETRQLLDMEGRIAYDNKYINNWSLLLDIKILMTTLIKGWVHKNAY